MVVFIRSQLTIIIRCVMSLCALLALPCSLLGSEPFIHNTSKGIELRNDLVSILISEDGELLSCVDLATKVNVADSKQYKIAYYTDEQCKNIVCNKVVLNDNILSLTMGDIIVDLLIGCYNHFFTVEVRNECLSNLKTLTFIDLKLDYDFKSSSFIGAGVAMTLHTNPVFFPSGESREVVGKCSTHTGIRGAKLAIIFCNPIDTREVIKEVYSFVPKGELPISTCGGPYALDNELIRRDCISTKNADPNQLATIIDVLSRYGISQIDFVIGPNTFSQGQFSFPTLGTATGFRRQISEPLLKAGIAPTMHTFSFYIGYGEKEILSNPHWQQQLEVRNTYVLSKGLSETDERIIFMLDDQQAFKMNINAPFYWRTHSPYMLIDNEFVKYTVNTDGKITIKRGQCGTIAQQHKSGAKVRVLGSYYSEFVPKPGSELFYEVARRTAKAYNEGGFVGVYFDAFDGLWTHLDFAGLGDYYGIMVLPLLTSF